MSGSLQNNKVSRAFIRLLLANKKYASLVSVLNTSRKSKSYFQRLITKILDNLEISITNVHIRYEDSLSIPRHVISAGVTISEFIVASADDSWAPRLTARTGSVNSKSFSMKKLIDLKNLSVYCHSNESISFEYLNPLQVI